MKRLFHRIALMSAAGIALLVVASMFGGRTSQFPGAVESAQFCPVAFKSEGSTTVYPIVRDAEAPFESLWGPGTDVQLASIGSGNGIVKLIAGEVEVAPSSRPLTAGEADSKNIYKIALDSFVIAVKNDSQMDFLNGGITIPQIQQIYTAGAGINGLFWDQLIPPIAGAPHRKIVPRARITGSGSQPDFLTKFSISAAAEAPTIDATGLPRLIESSDMAAEAAANLDQIAYTSLANLPPVANIKVVPLSTGTGPYVLPSQAHTIDGTYPAIRTLFLAVRNNSQNPRIDNTNVVRADDWVNYIRSAAAQSIISNAGFVPIAPGTRPPFPDWDVNLDGGTSLGDLGAVAAKWGQTSTCKGWIRADVNNSGNVSLADIGGVTNKWGQPGFACVVFTNPCAE